MTRKFLAVLAVAVEFAVMGGVVIPELSLTVRSWLTQLFVMGSYVLLLKWTWCAVSGRAKPEASSRDGNGVAVTQPIARAFSFIGFVRRRSFVLVAIVGFLAVLIVLSSRYRIVTADGSVYRLDRFSGRCDKVTPGLGNPHFVPIREHGEVSGRSNHASAAAGRSADDFNLTEFLSGSGRRK